MELLGLLLIVALWAAFRYGWDQARRDADRRRRLPPPGARDPGTEAEHDAWRFASWLYLHEKHAREGEHILDPDALPFLPHGSSSQDDDPVTTEPSGPDDDPWTADPWDADEGGSWSDWADDDPESSW